MKLLDELKKQAADTRNVEEIQARRQQQQEQNYQDVIRPRLLLIIQYLYEMVDQLKVVKLDIPVIYPLPGIGALELQQGLFKISIDNDDQPKKIALSMECVAAQIGIFPIHTNAVVRETRAFLDKFGVQYTEWAIRDQDDRVCGANFEGRIKVQVKFLWQANMEHNRLDMMSANFEGLGTKKMTFPMEQITQDWLDDLGHYILRRENKLGTLNIADNERDFIKTKLHHYKAKRKQELEIIHSTVAKEAGQNARKDKILDTILNTMNKRLW